MVNLRSNRIRKPIIEEDSSDDHQQQQQQQQKSLRSKVSSHQSSDQVFTLKQPNTRRSASDTKSTPASSSTLKKGSKLAPVTTKKQKQQIKMEEDEVDDSNEDFDDDFKPSGDLDDEDEQNDSEGGDDISDYDDDGYATKKGKKGGKVEEKQSAKRKTRGSSAVPKQKSQINKSKIKEEDGDDDDDDDEDEDEDQEEIEQVEGSSPQKLATNSKATTASKGINGKRKGTEIQESKIATKAEKSTSKKLKSEESSSTSQSKILSFFSKKDDSKKNGVATSATAVSSEQQKLKGATNPKQSSATEAAAAVSTTTENNDTASKGAPVEKGKRGFKRCKNELCAQLIYIHQKKCPHCHHEHKMATATFEQKQRNKKEKLSSTYEILNAFIAAGNGNPQQKIKKKDQLPIQQIKKNALYLDDFNYEKSNFTQMYSTVSPILLSQSIEPAIKIAKSNTSETNNNNKQLQPGSPTDATTSIRKFPLKEDLKTKLKLDFRGIEVNQVLSHMESFSFACDNQNEVSTESTSAKSAAQLFFGKSNQKPQKGSKVQQQQQQSQQEAKKPNWRAFIVNIGYPISCVAWNYVDVESDKDQYLAVGVNLKKSNENSGEKLENFRTLEAFELLTCHRIGLASYDEGALLIYKVAFDSHFHTYEEPKLVANIVFPGTPLTIKWLPKFVGNATESTLAVLSSDGAIYFYNSNALLNNPVKSDESKQSEINNTQQEQQQQQVQHVLKIQPKKEVILSCFDWLNDEQCSFIIAGDQVGNIYLFQLLGNAKYKVATFYSNAHQAHVTDIRFFQQSLQTDQILFASAGYDGLIKIYDIYGSTFPIYQYESCLKSVRSIAWDVGGKYMLVNRDKQSFSQIILSFFSTPISKKVELNCFTEARQLQKLHHDHVVTDSSCGMFSKYIFSASETGLIFANFTEQNRRIAVKKTKKKSSELEGFKICMGTFTPIPKQPTQEEHMNEFNFNINDFNALLRGRKINAEGDDDDDNEDIPAASATAGASALPAADEEIPLNNNAKNNKQKIEFDKFDNRSTVASIDATKTNIVSLNITVVEKKEQEIEGTMTSTTSTLLLDSFLAVANNGGILSIMKIFT